MPVVFRVAVDWLPLTFPREEKQHCIWRLGPGKQRWCGIWSRMELR